MRFGRHREWMVVAPGDVAATCWCEAEIVHIPAGDVGTSTGTCGRPGCTDPKETPCSAT